MSIWTKSPSGTGLPLVVLNGFLLQTCVLCLRRCSAVQVLLKVGADIQAKDKYGGTSLHKASQHGHPAVVEGLLKHIRVCVWCIYAVGVYTYGIYGGVI